MSCQSMKWSESINKWLSKPRHLALWLLAANLTVWAVIGLGAIGLWFLFK